MRGHEYLIALRLKNRDPDRVTVAVCPGKSWMSAHWHEWWDATPMVQIEPTDSVQRLDLRCLVGLCVDLMGNEEDAERIAAVYTACVAAGASRVLCAVYRTKGEWLDILTLTDSKGVLTWPTC